jgi:hypothetical protein
MAMPDTDEIKQQQQLINTYRRNLASLLQQAAQYGGESFAPLVTTNGIHEARMHIRHAKQALRGWGVTVDDHPNDETAGAIADVALAQADERRARLQALCADHSGFIRDRLESFVGRAAELAEIHARIDELLPTGGYVTITGQAGQGKSSVLAKLVEEYGLEMAAHHFIPFNPGPDHQVSLLRNLMARLILKHNLSELYVASESRPALRDYFVRVLKEISALGKPEIIFLDGLDQIEEDLTGVRDLSFLPTNPPTGVVLVLGTRPNDTLKPLELLKPHAEYPLRDLSRADFNLILDHRQVMLAPDLADRFYTAMERNALYLDLVARELAQSHTNKLDSIIWRIADNPENLFSLSIDRLKRQREQWHTLIKPVLGCLLVARESLSQRALRDLIGGEGDALREALRRLGGLVARDAGGQYYLYHLKFRDFLRQDPQRPDRASMFDQDEEEGYH